MRRLPLLLGLTLVVAVGSMSGPAWADHQGEPTGQFAVLSFEPVGAPDREVGNVVRQDYMSVSTFTQGPAVGTTVNNMTCLTVTGKRMVCKGEAVFTGTLAGATGTTTSRGHFTCDLPADPLAEPTLCKGGYRGVSGTDGLAGYRDVGTYESVPGSFFLYSYTAHEVARGR